MCKRYNDVLIVRFFCENVICLLECYVYILELCMIKIYVKIWFVWSKERVFFVIIIENGGILFY